MYVVIRYTFFFFAAVILLRCGNTSVSKQVYADKDVEGYWVTSNLLNHGTAQQLGFENEKGVKDFLRLRNSVNGHSDSTYYVKGQTLYLLSEAARSDTDGIVQRKFEAKYQIRFVSKERLILFDYNLQKELTYYSVMTAPKQSPEILQMGLSDNIYITADSAYYRKSDAFCSYGGVPPDSWKERSEKLDNDWKHALRELSLRFSSGIVSEMKDFSLGAPPSPKESLWLRSNSRLLVVNVSGKCTDPALVALYSELSAFRDWNRNHPPQERQKHIYPSRQNSWLLDSAAVEREKKVLRNEFPPPFVRSR